MSENEEINTASEIVKNRIDGLSTSIGVRLAQIKTTTSRASPSEKEKIADYLKVVQGWIDEILDNCYATKTAKVGFQLSAPVDDKTENVSEETE